MFINVKEKPLNIIEKILSRIEHRYELVVENESLLEVIQSSMRKRSLESSDHLLKYDSERQLLKKQDQSSDSSNLTSDGGSSNSTGPDITDPVVTYIPSADWVMYSMLDGKILF